VSLQGEAELRGALQGRRVVALRRRGKYLIVDLGGVALVVHLRMTGRLVFTPEPGVRAPRFAAHFAPGTDLYFYDTRRFGRVWAVEGAAEVEFFCASDPSRSARGSPPPTCATPCGDAARRSSRSCSTSGASRGWATSTPTKRRFGRA